MIGKKSYAGYKICEQTTDDSWLVVHGKWHTADGRWQIAKYTIIFLLIRVIVWDMEL
jgi:hypothetical protein